MGFVLAKIPSSSRQTLGRLDFLSSEPNLGRIATSSAGHGKLKRPLRYAHIPSIAFSYISY